MLKLLAALPLLIALPAAAAPLTRAQAQADASRAFDRADRNRDGVVTQAEVRLAAARSDSPVAKLPRGQRETLAHFWFARVDANRDGKLTRAEARAFAGRAFATADRNGDGRISPAERKQAEARAKRPARGR